MNRAERIEKYLVFRPFVPLCLAFIAGILLRLYAPGWLVPALGAGVVWLIVRQGSRVFGFLIAIVACGVASYAQTHRVLNEGDRTAGLLLEAAKAGDVRFAGQVLMTPDTPWEGAYHLIRLRRLNGQDVAPIVLVAHELCEPERSLALQGVPKGSDEWSDTVCAPDGYGQWVKGRVKYLADAGPWFRAQVPSQFRWDYKPLWIEADDPMKPLSTSEIGWVERLRNRAVARSVAALGCEAVEYSRDYCSLLSIFLGQSLVKPSFEVKEAFRKAGLIHLIVPSGTHVMFLILLLMALGSRFRLSRWVVFAGFVGVIVAMSVFFASLTIYRAALVALLFGIGQLMDTERDPVNGLCLAAMSLLAFDPEALFDGGFQLSFAASAGIAVIHVPMLDVFRKWLPDCRKVLAAGNPAQLLVFRKVLPDCREVLAAGIPAQLFMSPVLLASFRSLQIYSPLSNLVGVPLAGVLLPVGLVASFLALLGVPVITPLLFWIIKPALMFLLAWAHWISGLPLASLKVSAFAGGVSVALFAGMAVWGEAWNFRARWAKYALVGWMAALGALFIPTRTPAALVYSYQTDRFVYYPREEVLVGQGREEAWLDLASALHQNGATRVLFVPFPEPMRESSVNRISRFLTDEGIAAYFLPGDCWKLEKECQQVTAGMALRDPGPRAAVELPIGSALRLKTGRPVVIERTAGGRIEIFAPRFSLCLFAPDAPPAGCAADLVVPASAQTVLVEGRFPYAVDKWAELREMRGETTPVKWRPAF